MISIGSRFGCGTLFLVMSCLGLMGHSVSADQPAPTDPKIRLALNWKPEPEFGGFYAAQLAGAPLEIIPGGAGQPVVQMVASGQVEFGISSGDEVLIARDRGADVVALFAVYQTNPTGIMVHASRGFKNLGEFFKSEGMTLAIQKGLPHSTFLEKKYGFARVKTVPYAGGVGPFVHDPKFAQQCFVTSEPLLARRDKSDPQSFLIAESGYNPYTAVVIARGDLIRKSPERARKAISIFREGWKAYLSEPKAANEAMFKLNSSLDAAAYAESAELQKPLIQTAQTRKSGLGSMTLERWSELARQLVEMKLLKPGQDVSKAFWSAK